MNETAEVITVHFLMMPPDGADSEMKDRKRKHSKLTNENESLFYFHMCVIITDIKLHN